MAEKVVSKLRGNMWRLIILAVAGSLIYGLPYFRTYYYDAYLQAYNLTNTQMGSLGSIFGVFGMISYLFGGVVADFISPKKLISISLILTGVAGFCHLFATNYSMLLVIYLVWGFTALFAFWPALVKGIRSLASSEEQGKAYGFMEAGRGVTNAAHLAIALAIITAITSKRGSAAGLKGGIIFYSVVVIVLGILVLLFFKDPETSDKSERFNFKQVLTVMKLPQVWILCLILCCTYVMNMSYAYFNLYSGRGHGGRHHCNDYGGLHPSLCLCGRRRPGRPSGPAQDHDHRLCHHGGWYVCHRPVPQDERARLCGPVRPGVCGYVLQLRHRVLPDG